MIATTVQFRIDRPPSGTVAAKSHKFPYCVFVEWPPVPKTSFPCYCSSTHVYRVTVESVRDMIKNHGLKIYGPTRHAPDAEHQVFVCSCMGEVIE